MTIQQIENYQWENRANDNRTAFAQSIFNTFVFGGKS